MKKFYSSPRHDAAAPKSSSLKKAKSRSMLYERLEDRVLFDAVPDASLVADAEEPLNVDQANAARFDASLYAEDVKMVADSTLASKDETSHVADVRRELVIVDASVENYQQLANDLLMNAEAGREFEIALIDGGTDGISQVSGILAKYSDLDAVHVVSHGDETGIRFGDVWLTQSNFGGYAAEIAQWGNAFTENGDLLLLGCDVASTADGRQLLQSISTLTGTDVAASVDGTGYAPRGGDWDLEFLIGSTETKIAFSDAIQSEWHGLLAPAADASLNVPSQVPLGEDVDFTVTFRNTAPSGQVGYGPFVDVLIPHLGEDGVFDGGLYTDTADGLDAAVSGAVTYLGLPVNYEVLTLQDADGAGGLSIGTVTHPYGQTIQNETQLLGLAGTVDGGAFTLSFGGQTTSDIAWDADAATVQAALASLSSIGAGNIAVSGSLASGEVLELQFVGSMAASNRATIITDSSLLSGGGTAEVLAFVDGDSSAQATKVYGHAGDKLVVVELPFGSFTPEQPAAVINIKATMSDHADLNSPLTVRSRGGFRYGSDALNNPNADSTLFSDVQTNANNWVEHDSVTPTLLTISKTSTAPEHETATGPNYVRQWTVTVDIPDGQTITDLDIFDDLPNNIVFLSLDSITSADGGTVFTSNVPGGTNVLGSATNNSVFTGANSHTPLNINGVQNGESLVVTADSITGTTSDRDVSITFSFYVEEFDANGDRLIPINGEDDTTSAPDSRSHNNARALGDWTPVDVRDAGGIDNAAADPAGIEYSIDDKSIAVQKSVTVVDAAGNPTGQDSVVPGSLLKYTLSFQISDYYTYGDLVLTDTFSDGQLFYTGLGPSFSVSDFNNSYANSSFNLHAGPQTGATSEAATDNFIVDQSRIDRGDDAAENSATDGTTHITIQLSERLQQLGDDGILQGGLSNGAANLGAATGTITFYTQVQDEFADAFPSGDRSVDQGDVLTNGVAIAGAVRENQEDDTNGVLFETLHNESDSRRTSIRVQQGSLAKSIYAVNGSTSFSGTVDVAPGDRITYRLTYQLPTSDFEDLTITDYFPLPIFRVADADADGLPAANWTFDADQSSNQMLPGVVELLAVNGAAGDTFYDIWDMSDNGLLDDSVAPSLSIDTNANSVTIDFGRFDDTGFQASQVDLLLTVTVQNDPFADGLLLTNQAIAAEGSTNGTPVSQVDLIQVRLTEPVIDGISKGIVDSEKTTAFAAGGLIFSETTATAGFTGGTLNSDWLDNNTFDTLITDLDAGDRARFAVVAENTGSSRHGAFDVTITDTLDAGLSYVAGSLRVYDGNGNLLTYSGSDADLLAGGITLDDPTATSGALAEFDATNGSNVAVLIYDVTIDSTAQPLQELNNTAALVGYAGQEGGQNHVVTPPEASAGVAVINVAATKSLDGTSEAHTTFVGGVERVAIGEVVRYRIEMEVPEGTSPLLTLRDKLPSGLTFIDDGTAKVVFVSDGGNMTSSALSGAGLNVVDTGALADIEPTFVLPDVATSESDDPGIENDTWATGNDVYFKLGTVVNSDSDADKEYVVIEFNALVDNNSSPRNDVNESLYNDLEVLIDSNANGTIESSEEIYDLPNGQRPRVQIVEPLIQSFAKTVDFNTGDAGDPVSYTISFSVATGNTRTDAFDVNLTDTVPAEMLLNTASMQVRVDGALQTAGTDYTDNSSGSTFDLTFDRLAMGADVTITFEAVIDIRVNPTEQVVNRANVTWTSLPGDFGTANGTAGNATGSDLASLDDVNTGDSANPEYNTRSGETQGERDGSGQNDPATASDNTQPNDYHATSTAVVTIDGTSITKTLDRTSIDDSATTANNVRSQAVIGEVATYTVTLDFNEATIPNATLTDNLQQGLAFIGVTGTTVNGVTLDAAVDLTDPTVSNNGRTVVWDLQTIVDAAHGTPDTDGRITITYEAVVTNAAANVEGVLRRNTATFQWDDNPTTAPNPREVVAASADVAIIEPEIVVTKSVALDTDQDSNYDDGTTGDAGDGIQYTITLTNRRGVDAFDMDFSDDMPLAGGGLSAILNPVLTVTDNATTGSVSASDFELVGDNDSGWTVRMVAGRDIDMLGSQVDSSGNPRVITLTITGSIGDAVAPNQAINNVATATWTSQNGTFIGPSPYTADDTERTGIDGAGADNLNNYESSRNAIFTVTQPAFSKHFVDTDRSETAGTNVTIGETVTYALRVQLPEGTSPDTTVIDQLPDGLKYVSSQIVTSAAASGGLLANDFNGTIVGGIPTVSGGAASGDDVTFTFDQITIGTNNDGSDNSFLLLVDAIVVDQSSNAGYAGHQTILSNRATIDFSTDSLPPQSTGLVNVTVVEPSLSITKEFGPTVDTDLADAGDTVSIVLTVDNTTGTSAAYDVVIEDVLDPTFYDISTVDFGTAGTACPNDFTPSIDTVSGRLLYSGGTIATGATQTFTFSVKLLNTVLPDATDVNTATITDATTLSGSVSGERNMPDADGDNSHTDTDTVRVRSNSLSGFVWDDPNNDGIFDGSENGLTGVAIQLVGVDHLGNGVDVTLLTGAGGAYSFTGLRPGTYRIVEDPNGNTIPAGLLDGKDAIGTPGGDSSVNDQFTNIELPTGVETHGTGNNFGEIQPASMSGTVFYDANADTSQNAATATSSSEPGLAGIAVALDADYDEDGIVDETIHTFTDAQGDYQFTNLKAGEFTVRVVPPAGTSQTYDADGILTAHGSSFSLLPTQHNGVQDFGYTGTSSLSDTVFFDIDNDGVDDTATNDRGLANVDVTLSIDIDGNGTADYTTTLPTDSNGNFQFANLLPGTYTLTTDGTDMAAGLANNPTVDNDGLTTPHSADYTVGIGESVMGTGFGFHAVPDYDIVKTGNFSIASAGDTVQYTITVKNVGELDGRNITIVDDFPKDVLTITNASGGTVDNSAGTIEWNLAAMQPDEQVVLTVTATVKDPIPAGIDTFTNSVNVDDDHYNGDDPDTSNNTSSYKATLDTVPEYAITKSNDGTVNLRPGDQTTYTISVTNNGKQDGTGVIVTDRFPLDTLEVVDADGGTVDKNAGTITWNVGDLDVGDTVFFNVTFDVVDTANTAQTDVVNHADVHDDGRNGADPNLTNNTASDTDPLVAAPDYRLTKTMNGSPAFVEPGQSISYSIFIENIGDQNGTGVVVTDRFPVDLLTNVNAVGGTVDAVNGTITWNVGDLAGGGESVLLTVTADVRASVATGVEVLVNNASVTDDLANGPDPTPTNNADEDTTTLQAQPDLTVTKTDGDLDYAEPGDTVVYTITYNNFGNQDSTGVTITENLPDGSTFDASASTSGWIDNRDGTFTFHVGNLNTGDGGAIEFAVIADDVIDPNREELVNTVSITDDLSNGTDPTPENNVAEDTTPLQVFVFDSFQDPSGYGKDMDGYNRRAVHLPHGDEFAHRLKPLPIDTVYTGIVDPGTTLSGKIYDQSGRLVGEQTVVADSAGNWLMQFPTVVLYEQPHEMRVDQTLAVQNSTNFAGFNLRRFFHPAIHSPMYMNEPISVGAAFRHDPFSVVQAMHAANNDPLGFDWTHHAYELIVSSSNTSAM